MKRQRLIECPVELVTALLVTGSGAFEPIDVPSDLEVVAMRTFLHGDARGTVVQVLVNSKTFEPSDADPWKAPIWLPHFSRRARESA